ncbi:hypothetical protein DXG03_006849 [Asterophora parasitica]|uniref:Chitinase n=1 Tax=Asterophora parasitica TaxID=117018 RepID=A0A9P7GDR1_9AGAR|nr:hypothetical protein DXG03_006849 [Asterophora parasitica]
MATVQSISIFAHTTSSSPNPHILYLVKAVFENGQQYQVLRRYSQFVALHEYLGDSFTLPPKRIFTNAIVPSTWIDDKLIAERKAGLEGYLNHLKAAPEIKTNIAFLQFLSHPSFDVNSLSANVKSLMTSCNVTAVGRVSGDTTIPIAAAYYPTWSAWENPPNRIDFSKFDILFFAFATPNASSGLNWDEGSEDTLRTLVSAARQSRKGTKIVLSVGNIHLTFYFAINVADLGVIGGWGGSYWFNNATKDATNRSKFNNALVAAVNNFGLDGIDIDWEYPNSEGSGNPHSPADSANLLALLKQLRSSLGPSKIISAAVAHMPWLGANGKPLTNVSEYAKVMSFVNIMNYDVSGASANPGPNAPLGNLCGTSKLPQASAQAAFAQWTRAGFPPSKLMLGLALYGYVSKSTAKRLSSSVMPDSSVIAIPHPRGPFKDLSTAAPNGDLSTMWGQQIAFRQLVQFGALKKRADGNYDGANGYTHCDKTKFARKSGMAGCFTWSLDQDDGLALHSVMRTNLGRT